MQGEEGLREGAGGGGVEGGCRGEERLTEESGNVVKGRRREGSLEVDV